MNIKESLISLAEYTGFDNKTKTHRLGLFDNDKIIITQRSKIPNFECLTGISYDLKKIETFLKKKKRKIDKILMNKGFKGNSDQLFSNITHIFVRTYYIENATDQQKQFLCDVIKKNGFSRLGTLKFFFEWLESSCREGGNLQDFIMQFEKYSQYFSTDGIFDLFHSASLNGLIFDFSRFIPFFSKEPSKENASICRLMCNVSPEKQQQVIDAYTKLVEICDYDLSSKKEMSEAFRYLIHSNGVSRCVLFKNIPEHIDDQIRWKNLILSLDYPYTNAQYVEFSKNWPVCLNLPDMTLSKILTELSKFLPYTSAIGALSIFMKSNGQEDKLLELMEDLKDELISPKDLFDIFSLLVSLVSEEPLDRESEYVDSSKIFLNLLDVPREKRLQLAKMLKEVTELPLGFTVELLSPENYDGRSTAELRLLCPDSYKESDEKLELLLKNLPDYLLKYLPFFAGFMDKPKQEVFADIVFIPELVTALFHFENVWKNEKNTEEEINRKSEYFGELLEKFKRFRKIPYFIESDGVEEPEIRKEIKNLFPMERFLKFLEKNQFEKMTPKEMHVFLNGEKTENLMEDWSNYYDIPSNKKSARTSKVLNS